MSINLKSLGEQIDYYDFNAGSLADAEQQMVRLGPRDEDGNHAAAVDHRADLANTVARLVPNSTKKMPGVGWVSTAYIEQADFRYGFIFTFPRWSNVETLSRPIQGEWARYTQCLWVHERGHITVCIPIFKNYLGKFEKLRIMGTGSDAPSAEMAALAEVSTQLKGLFELMTDEVRKASRSYDRKKVHGRTQGALLNTRVGLGSRR